MKKPCKEYPYLKTSAKGYLGESSGNPQEFLYQLESPEAIHDTMYHVELILNDLLWKL